jgi:hypothetical protein
MDYTDETVYWEKPSREVMMFKYVLSNAKKNEPDTILKAVDQFCWNGHWMNHVGDRKGALLDKAVK